MLLLNLRGPLDEVATVVQTEEHPLSYLRGLDDRGKAVIIGFQDDLKHTRFSCIAFEPETGRMVTAEAERPIQAYEKARALYERAIGQAPVLQ